MPMRYINQDEVFAVIEQRFRGPLSLSDVAEAVHLSPGHLTTAVRRQTGRTVQDWIVQRRMTKARRLLVETDLGAAEVGRRIGYPDATYFSRVFRRTHEQKPACLADGDHLRLQVRRHQRISRCRRTHRSHDSVTEHRWSPTRALLGSPAPARQ